MVDFFFAFENSPFLSVPDVAHYFPSESMENARKTIISVLERNAGIPLVFGRNGMGKSLCLRMIGKHFELDDSVLYIANPGIKTAKSLFQQLLFGLQQPYCGLDENELRLQFWNYLYQFETPNLLILIDEAQTLSRTVLEELRVLLHYDNGKSAKMKVVFAGLPAFEEHLTHPKLSGFQQRVVVRCYLDNFRWNETEDYLVWQLHQAGVAQPESVFSSAARKNIHQLTEGVPRLVNQLADMCLTLASTSVSGHERKTIDEEMVREAWGTLQQLPVNPPLGKSHSTSSASGGEHLEIEFGELPEEEELLELEELPEEAENQEKREFYEITKQESTTDFVRSPSLEKKSAPFYDFFNEMRVMEATIAQEIGFSQKSEGRRTIPLF